MHKSYSQLKGFYTYDFISIGFESECGYSDGYNDDEHLKTKFGMSKTIEFTGSGSGYETNYRVSSHYIHAREYYLKTGESFWLGLRDEFYLEHEIDDA
jgi:hypothetical protein